MASFEDVQELLLSLRDPKRNKSEGASLFRDFLGTAVTVLCLPKDTDLTSLEAFLLMAAYSKYPSADTKLKEAKIRDAILMDLGLLNVCYHTTIQNGVSNNVDFTFRQIYYLTDSDYITICYPSPNGKKNLNIEDPKSAPRTALEACARNNRKAFARAIVSMVNLPNEPNNCLKNGIAKFVEEDSSGNRKIKLPEPAVNLKNFPLTNISEVKTEALEEVDEGAEKDTVKVDPPDKSERTEKLVNQSQFTPNDPKSSSSAEDKPPSSEEMLRQGLDNGDPDEPVPGSPTPPSEPDSSANSKPFPWGNHLIGLVIVATFIGAVFKMLPLNVNIYVSQNATARPETTSNSMDDPYEISVPVENITFLGDSELRGYPGSEIPFSVRIEPDDAKGAYLCLDSSNTDAVSVADNDLVAYINNDYKPNESFLTVTITVKPHPKNTASSDVEAKIPILVNYLDSSEEESIQQSLKSGDAVAESIPEPES